MQHPARLQRHAIGAALTAVAGIAAFFVIVGVFGLPLAVLALLGYATLAVLIFSVIPDEETGR